MIDFGTSYHGKHVTFCFGRYPYGVYLLPQITFGFFKDTFEYMIPFHIRFLIFSLEFKIYWKNKKGIKRFSEE